MPKYFDQTEKQILEAIDTENLDMVLRKFDTIDRLSGSVGELQAIRYITEKLEDYGIPYQEYVFESYLSNPISASLTVFLDDGSKKDIPAKTRAFSANCPEGLTGELVYAPAKGGITFDTVQINWTREQVEGKIIISEGGGTEHMDKAAELGALALVHVWPSAEDVIHEMTASAIWGTPTPETARFLPVIPEVSIKNSDGTGLIEMAKTRKVLVHLTAVTESGVYTMHMPVAEIKGKTDDYVLLAGHIDSWYVGITDNAVGNALCLELARVFYERRNQLKRSIKIAWWPGHSNGRYAGSTFYCDKEFENLREHCVAYLNADSPGSRFGVIPLVRSTLSEKKGFFQDTVRDITGLDPQWDYPIRGGDNSMWGAFVPFHVMLRDKPDPQHADAQVGGSGGGWWWHTEEDTYDKADLQLLLRDSKVFASFALRIMQSDILPVDIEVMAGKMIELLQEYQRDMSEDFDLTPVIERTGLLKSSAEMLNSMKVKEAASFNQFLKHAAGRLNALMYTQVSPYYQDVAFDLKPFHGFYRVCGVNRENRTDQEIVFLKTDFQRQVNRFLTEVGCVITKIKHFI